MCRRFWKYFIFFNERAAASERYQCATASEKKCAADIFMFVAASKCISMIFNERAAASEKILTTASKSYQMKKCAADS